MSTRDLRKRIGTAAADLPKKVIFTTSPLYRVHRETNSPIWFSNDGNYRFDPVGNRSLGTCYLSLSEIGAFVETFGRLGVIRQDHVDARSMTEIYGGHDLRVIDLTDRSVLGEFGLTADIQVGSDYRDSQMLAAVVADMGFDGILYAARHDPALTSRSLAVFGQRSGTGKELIEHATAAIPDWVMDQAAREFGLRVLPAAPPSAPSVP